MGEIIRNLSFDEYRAIDAVNQSFLSEWEENALRAEWERENPREKTPALILGERVHTAVLEPERFKKTYRCATWLDRRSNHGKERWAAVLADHKGDEKAAEKAWKSLCDRVNGEYEKIVAEVGEEGLISDDEMRQCAEMCRSLESHERAGKLLGSLDERELTLVFDLHGVRCKARIDGVKRAGGFTILVDLKTTESAKDEAFFASIFTYKYYRQAAFYLAGARACGIEATHFSIAAIEKEAPWGRNLFRLSDRAIEQGEREIEGALLKYSLCRGSKQTPGYSRNVIEADLPEWGWRRIESTNHIGG